ncbi:flagellin N-terminal-like domain protein [Segatella baroniae F0067]|uniref:Flagellin N-terminal-like domain protein n=1 Tax=Segatella baroniae F0067 TaxID=1115809 RepID=U2NQ80_9BACT|nr:flagellin N-terminal-like domain protein [Segatella baroniae F0067]
MARVKREAKQEEQARKVVNGIFGTLIILAILFMLYSILT